MSKRHFKIVPFLVAFAVVCSCVFSVPVSVSAAGMVEIDIYDYLTGKDYIGSDVIVHYDLPLDAHTELYGMPYNGSAYEYITSGQWVSFSQTLDKERIVSTRLFTLNARITQNAGGYYLYSSSSTSNLGNVLPETNLILFNGVGYAVSPFYFYMEGEPYLAFGNPNIINKSLSPTDYPFLVLLHESTKRYFIASSNSLSSVNIQFYREEVYTDDFEYSKITSSCWPLGMENDNWRIIDISDIRTGANFDLTFNMLAKTYLKGHAEYSDMSFKIYYVDKNFDHVKTDTGYIDTGELMDSEIDHFYFDYTVSFTVPEGAEYFYLSFHTNEFDVSDCSELTFYLDHLTMSCGLSAIEDNSNTMKQVQKKLEEYNAKLDELDQSIQDTNIKLDKIEDALTPTPEQSDKADQMEDAIGNAAGSLENNSSSLEQLTPNKPQISTDLQLDEPNLLAVSPLVTNIWSISGLSRMVGIVIMIATVAYVFFGKRDG